VLSFIYHRIDALRDVPWSKTLAFSRKALTFENPYQFPSTTPVVKDFSKPFARDKTLPESEHRSRSNSWRQEGGLCARTVSVPSFHENL